MTRVGIGVLGALWILAVSQVAVASSGQRIALSMEALVNPAVLEMGDQLPFLVGGCILIGHDALPQWPDCPPEGSSAGVSAAMVKGSE